MRSVRHRVLSRVACCLAGVVATAGCVSLPTDSPVRPGRDLGVQDEPQLNSHRPAPPAEGAAPAEIVAGYFESMLAYPRSESLTRSFLTPTAAKRWDPAEGLVVYDDETLVVEGETLTFRSRRLGALDDRGSWTSSTPASSAITLPVRVERVDGEWRLANPPAGTYIDSDYFDRYFDPFALYFFDPTSTILAPDPVYALLGESTPTVLVRNLLKGPSRRMSGIVSTAAPDDLTITAPVTLSPSGVAEISLSTVALTMTSEEQALLAAQLVWTLLPLPEVREIALTVDGQPLTIEGSGTQFSVEEAFEGYDPAGFAVRGQLFGITRQGLVRVTQDGSTLLPAPIATALEKPRSVAVDPSGALAAVVSRQGSRVVVGQVFDETSGTSTWFRGGKDLLRPSWDLHQVLWLVDRTSAGARIYVTTGDQTRTVKAAGITGQRVLSFAISRDATRMAAIVSQDGRTRLVIAMIDRSPDDPLDVTLSSADPVFVPSVSFSGTNNLVWMSPTSVAVLADEVGGDLQPFEVSIDGSTITAFDGFLPVRPRAIASGPNVEIPVLVGSRRGELYVRDPESGWEPFGGGSRVRSPAYPG